MVDPGAVVCSLYDLVMVRPTCQFQRKCCDVMNLCTGCYGGNKDMQSMLFLSLPPLSPTSEPLPYCVQY